MFDGEFDERVSNKIEANFILKHDRQRPRINFKDNSRDDFGSSVSNFLNPALVNIMIAFDLELLLRVELQLKPNFASDNFHSFF